MACTVSIEEELLVQSSSLHKCKTTIGWLIVYKRHLKQWAERRKVLTEVMSSSGVQDVDSKVDYQVKLEKAKMKPRVVHLSVEDLQDAEVILVKTTQSKYFSNEFKSLSSKKHVTKKSPIKSLDPILVDGVIRVGG